MYVDFVETDEGDEWLSPAHWDDGFDITSGAVRLVAALHLAGFSTVVALSVVADVWQGFTPRMDTHWTDVARRSRETLERMRASGVVSQATTDSETRILDHWSYPLHQAALEKVKVKVNDLRPPSGGVGSWDLRPNPYVLLMRHIRGMHSCCGAVRVHLHMSVGVRLHV